MQRGFAPIVILIGAVLIGVVAAGGVYYFQKQQTIKKINSFEQCSKAGYSVMESYPARCNTPDGRSFTQVISREEKKKLIPPKNDKVCIQVITPAKNSKTGECKDFPTPCDVPAGWDKVDSCGAGSMDTTNNGLTKIARQAMVDYLESYKNKSAGERQIADYSIDKIGSVQIVPSGIEFYVVFSIKPLGPLSRLLGTDNGIDSEDGWIRNKSGGAMAIKEGSIYKIQGIGTGFPTQVNKYL